MPERNLLLFHRARRGFCVVLILPSGVFLRRNQLHNRANDLFSWHCPFRTFSDAGCSKYAQGVDNPFSLEILSEEFEKFGRYHLALGMPSLGLANAVCQSETLARAARMACRSTFCRTAEGHQAPWIDTA